jgi:HK97 family phage portal protein
VGRLSRAWAYISAAPAPIETRAIDSFTDHPGLTEQLLAVQGLRSRRAWSPPGVRDALGIPAVFRAVTLISNLVGTFTLEAFRNGARLEAIDTPRILQRPDPFRTARDFWRDSGWNLATLGEAIWYIGARDVYGAPLSLLNVPPAELIGTFEDPVRDPVLGRISWTWRGASVPARDLVQITFAREPGSARGIGPLQLCGAALTVATEAEAWAANYYGTGGIPSILLSPRMPVDTDEVSTIKRQWLEGDPNTPKVAAEVDVHEISGNAQQAQLAEARLQSVGDVATMFGIPPDLLEHAMVGGGSSITYRNLAEIGTDLVRFCLVPGYLEPIEQTISDLVPRSIMARFNVDEIERADAETRIRIHAAAIAAGIYDVAEAQRREGLVPGSAQYAPVPANAALPAVPLGVRSSSTSIATIALGATGGR